MNPEQSRLLDPPKLLLGGQSVLQTPVVLGTPPPPPPLLLLLLALLPAMLGMRGGRLVVTAMPEGFHCAAANSDTELGCEGCLRLLDCRRPLIGLSITAGLLVWPVRGARTDDAVQPLLMEWWLRCCLAGGTTTEPSAAGAAAPLRDLTRCREAPSSARTGLMAKYDRRPPVDTGGGLPGGGVTISCKHTAAPRVCGQGLVKRYARDSQEGL
jgi:hypothetical protein